jgi:hypothetical protein
MNKETGGPAFPINVDSQIVCLGITARDYFAAKAMQGAISGSASRADKFLYAECAGLAYEMADAMLRAREAK